MSLSAVGVDVVSVGRVRRMLKRWGDRLLERLFLREELDSFSAAGGRPGDGRFDERVAARVAAKEAVMKVLGTGRDGIAWREIVVTGGGRGGLRVRLTGRAESEAGERGITRILVSVTHDGGMAAAVAVGCSG